MIDGNGNSKLARSLLNQALNQTPKLNNNHSTLPHTQSLVPNYSKCDLLEPRTWQNQSQEHQTQKPALRMLTRPTKMKLANLKTTSTCRMKRHYPASTKMCHFPKVSNLNPAYKFKVIYLFSCECSYNNTDHLREMSGGCKNIELV